MSGAIGRKRYGTRPWGAYEDTSSPLGRIARLREAGTHTRLPLLIAIDGADGCGKSSLASWLAWQLGMPAIQLDLYLSELHPMQWLAVELARVVNRRARAAGLRRAETGRD
jgi:pantothenate kinase-related protein Tda10